MAQKLRALEALPQVLSSAPSTLPGSSQLSVTPTWEELGVLCLLFLWHLHSHVYTQCRHTVTSNKQ